VPTHRRPQHRPWPPAALALALLASCGGPAPADRTIAVEAPSIEAAASTNALQCMPTALVTQQLPLEEGFSLPVVGDAAGTAVVDCLLSLFGDRPLKSPMAFDRDYATVFAFHEEDGTRTLASMARDDMHLSRLGDTAGASVWLLRIDAGTEMEGSRHDVLFSVDRAHGTLVDQLLVGAMGLLYRRDYDIDAADAFSLREDTGRGDAAGPGYRARYRVQDDGRFARVSAQVLTAQRNDPGGTVGTGGARATTGLSLETLPGDFGALAPIRALLFDDGEVEERAIVRIDGAPPRMVAVGRSGTAGLALYVLEGMPSPAAPAQTLYRVSGQVLAAPPGATAVVVRGQRWLPQRDGGARIVLSLRYAVPAAGDDRAAGAPTTTQRDLERTLRYDAGTGALVPEHAG